MTQLSLQAGLHQQSLKLTKIITNQILDIKSFELFKLVLALGRALLHHLK